MGSTRAGQVKRKRNLELQKKKSRELLKSYTLLNRLSRILNSNSRIGLARSTMLIKFLSCLQGMG
jgi:hypothetical protein